MGERRQGSVEFRQQALAGAYFFAQGVLVSLQEMPQALRVVQRAIAFQAVDGFQRNVQPAQREYARELLDLFRLVVAVAVSLPVRAGTNRPMAS